MKGLVLAIVALAVAVAVTGYKDRRNNAFSSLEGFPAYPEARRSVSFREQHQPFREVSLNAPQFQLPYRHRVYRQDLPSFAEQLSFGDRESWSKGYSSPRTRQLYGDGSFFGGASKFKGQPSFFSDQMSFEERTALKNDQLLRDQATNDRYSYQQPAFRDDFRFADLYEKPISSYKEQRAESPTATSEYFKHGNHGLGYIPVSPVSPYENAFPPNDGASSTMPSYSTMPPTTTHEPLHQSTVSTVGSLASDLGQIRASATSEMKMASPKTSHTIATPNTKSDKLTDVDSSTANPSISTKAEMSFAAKQSSNLVHPYPTKTTEASLPVVATEEPIVSFGRQTVPPVEFEAAKFTTPSSYYFSSGAKNKLQQMLLSYLLSQQGREAVKINGQTLLSNYVSPDISSNSLDNKIPTSLFNCVLPTESKSTLNDNLQSSLFNYLLQQESNRGLSFQRSSSPTEAVNYASLTTLTEKPKFALPSVPIATLSAVSRPLQTVNYLPLTLPRTSTFPAHDSSSSSSLLPLAAASFPTSLSSSTVDSQASGVFNSLPGEISGGITAGIPANIATTVPANVPTLNFAQHFQHLGQSRQFEPAKNEPFSTGLQLQLGGFGGIDYSLRSSNLAQRPMELGIAKVGLSLPELPRQQLSTLPKVSLGHHLW